MLEQLKLSNLALSNQAEVDFTPGMICITGETGAGKSLVVDALSLVLGAKADANLVRQGQKKLEISALFSIEGNHRVHELLEEHGFIDSPRKKAKRTASALAPNTTAAVSSAAHPLSTIVNSTGNALSHPQIESAINHAQDVALASLEAQGLGHGSDALETADHSTHSVEQTTNSSSHVPLSQTAIVADGQAIDLAPATSNGDLSLDINSAAAAGASGEQIERVGSFVDTPLDADLPTTTAETTDAAEAAAHLQAVHNAEGGEVADTSTDPVTPDNLGNPDSPESSEILDSSESSDSPDNQANSATAQTGASEGTSPSKIELDPPAKIATADAAANAAASSKLVNVRDLPPISNYSAQVDLSQPSAEIEIAHVVPDATAASAAAAAAGDVAPAQTGADSGTVAITGATGLQEGSVDLQAAAHAPNLAEPDADFDESLEESAAVAAELAAEIAADAAAEAEAEAEAADGADFEDDEEYNELILRRVVSAEGKSKAYINGHMATLSQLREISEHLVSIHGQHASVRLMDEDYQLEIVDNYGKLKELVGTVNRAFNQYSDLRHNLTELSEKQKLGAAEYKQDRYDLEELKRLDFKEGDFEILEQDFDKAKNHSKFKCAVTNMYKLLDSGETNLISLMQERLIELDTVKNYDQRIGPLMESIDATLINLSDCSIKSEDLLFNSMEIDHVEIEEKMSKVNELARRFSCQPRELYLMTAQIEEKVEKFLSLKDQINELTQEVKESRQRYEELCQNLTEQRHAVAQELAQQIGSRVKELALPDARFDIVLTRDNEGRPRLNGRDNLCFMFSANLGQELRPLSAVASGGELSRLALIIEVLTASVKSTPTLIFDEVDTGISGRTASAVGSLLKELGQYVQVITVTHLPQVAAKAHTQFVVAKYNEDGQVNSTISMLDEQGRIEEISRMIGGSVITETTRKSALELLNE